MTRRLVIGSRGSNLALTQSRHVADLLRKVHPDAQIDIEVIKTKGDRILDAPLAAIGGKGLFTKELEDALLDHRIDLAVHSLKDLPTESPKGLVIGAIPARANPADVFVADRYASIAELPPNATVGTSSLRRKAQLLAYRKDLNVVNLRGNVDTRLRRVTEGKVDAAILAAAGLERLGHAEAVAEQLSPDVVLSAVGQGALAIQCRENDEDIQGLLDQITDKTAQAEVAAERAFLHALGGGCQTPIAALARARNGTIAFVGRVCSLDGTNVLEEHLTGDVADAAALGQQAAQAILDRGGRDIIASAVHEHGDAGHPLAGIRIVVTRARAQGRKLADLLEGLGAEVIEFPTIEIQPADLPSPLPNPRDYDWIIFSSANAVKTYVSALENAGISMTGANTCAVGPATASALRERGVHVTLIPEQFVAEGILKALTTAEESLETLKILLPRGDLARGMLPEELTARGADTTELVVYYTRAPEVPEKRITQLLESQPHVITFTSSSTAQNFVDILGQKHLDALKSRTAFAAIGPITAETAEELGLPIAIVPVQHDAPGLTRALVEWAKGAGSTQAQTADRNVP